MGLCCDHSPKVPISTAASTPPGDGAKAPPSTTEAANEVTSEPMTTNFTDFMVALLTFDNLIETSSPAIQFPEAKELLRSAAYLVGGEGKISIESVDFRGDDRMTKFRDMPVEEHIAQLERMGLHVSVHTHTMRRTVGNLRARTQSELVAQTFTVGTVQMIVVDVFVQLTCLVAVPFCSIMGLGAWVQSLYANSIGAGSNPLSLEEYYFETDTILDQLGQERGIYIGTSVLSFYGLYVCVFIACRLVYGYLEPRDSLLRTIIRKGVGVVLAGTAVLFIAWACLFVIWLLFAGLINPVRNLAQAAAVIVFVGAISITWTHLRALSKDIDKEADSALNTLLKDSTISFIEEKRSGHPKKEAWLEELQGENQSEEVAYDVIMDVFDMGDDHKLSFEEFSNLLDTLKISVDYNMRQKMFQFADMDNSKEMDNSEFETAWQYLKEDLTDLLKQKNHLDDESILKICGGILIFFLLFFPFFFLAIALWQNSSSFTSVIHSMFMTGMGAQQVVKNRRPTAADGKVKGLSDSIKKMVTSMSINASKKMS